MLILCLTSLVHVGLGELIYLVMILLNNPIIEKNRFQFGFTIWGLKILQYLAEIPQIYGTMWII